MTVMPAVPVLITNLTKQLKQPKAIKMHCRTNIRQRTDLKGLWLATGR